MTPERVQLIGIAGASGSGKTELAHALVAALGGDRALLIAHDDYYKPLSEAQRGDVARVDFDQPDALDNDLLAAHLGALRARGDIDVPTYSFVQHTRTGSVRRASRPYVVVEGVLLLAVPALRDQLDLRVFVDTAQSVCLERRIVRDVATRGRTDAGVRAQWAQTVAPAWQLHGVPSQGHAQLVVDGTRPVQEAVRAVLAQLGPPHGTDPRNLR